MTAPRSSLAAGGALDRELMERVLCAVPITQPAFSKLLSLLDICASDEVETACVTLGVRSRLLLNPEFVARHCRTDEALAMLVMHELYHVLLGHTRLFARVSPAHNLAFDALVNAQLCLLFPGRNHTALFRQLYAEEELPWALLRPPAGWPDDPRWRLEGEAGRLHRALYTDSSVTTVELFRLLERLFAQRSGQPSPGETPGPEENRGQDGGNGTGGGGSAGDDGNPQRRERREARPRRGSRRRERDGGGKKGAAAPGREARREREENGDRRPGGRGDAPGSAGRSTEILLGNHDGDGTASGSDPDMTRAIREIVARWPMHERISGRDDGGDRARERIRVAEARREAVALLRRAILPLLDRGEGWSGLPRPGAVEAPAVLPYRTVCDRRAELQALLGGEPLFFRGRQELPEMVRKDRVHVYVDVSGSMAGELPLVYGALVPLLPFLHPRIHLFSTVVEDVPAAALRRGAVTSTGGTDIACVTGHMVEHQVRRAVIVTDGWVGKVPDERRQALGRRGARVASVVTHGGDPSFAGAFRGAVHRLPRLA